MEVLVAIFIVWVLWRLLFGGGKGRRSEKDTRMCWNCQGTGLAKCGACYGSRRLPGFGRCPMCILGDPTCIPCNGTGRVRIGH